MPVRIYDIAKKLGMESKEVLVKAKALGIVAAKVPSSSLDKITAEHLEGELFKDHPDLAAKLNAPAPVEKPKPVVVEEKIVLIIGLIFEKVFQKFLHATKVRFGIWDLVFDI